MKLVGVDCAVKHQNVAAAVGTLADDKLTLLEVRTPKSDADLIAFLADNLRNESAALLALDAPLGWPESLALGLAQHRAGDPHEHTADRMFRRVTDDVVYQRLRKRSLDVGADRIARTAHAALLLLAELRRVAAVPLPLAWNAGAARGVAVIEVYPAASAVSRGWSARGYKKSDGISARRSLVRMVRSEISMSDALAKRLAMSDHLLDSALCVLGAADFARGDVIPPNKENRQVALREGWIWVRPPP